MKHHYFVLLIVLVVGYFLGVYAPSFGSSVLSKVGVSA